MIEATAPCGVRYGIRRGFSDVAYCALTISGGTRSEGDRPEGLAHFTEHALFKGTARKSARVINSYLDRLGGELNAYTTKEEIVLHATVLKEDLRKAAGLLLELATEPVFPDREIDIERGVILDEIASYKDSPADDVYDCFEEKLFADHPLSRPILGTLESVTRITPSVLSEFVASTFKPSSMALTVVADLDEAQMEKTVLSLLQASFPDAPAAVCSPFECRGPLCQPFRLCVDKKNHEVNAVIGAEAPSLYDSESRLAAALLGNILAGPASNSLLGNILREKNGWVYGVESSYTQYADTGVMAICLGCDKTNLEHCLDAVRKQTSSLATHPLSETFLKAAKKQFLGQLAISSASGEAQCLSMGKSLVSFGHISTEEENRRKIEAVTADDICRAARDIFDREKLSSLIFL